MAVCAALMLTMSVARAARSGLPTASPATRRLATVSRARPLANSAADGTGGLTRRCTIARLTALAGTALPPWAAVPSAASAASLAAAGAKPLVFTPRSAPLDERQYRALVFPSGLRALLVSDMTAERAGAALSVRAGSFDEPSTVPGLAHFCEHMLFLGTTEFPEEGDFDAYVSAAAGSNNAFTASEETAYFFEVDGAKLAPSFERFSSFFAAPPDGPLFTPSATERELSAIEAEFQKNLQSDAWRELGLLRTTSAALTAGLGPGGGPHPFARFSAGNRRTLVEEPAARGIDVRAELLRYHAAKYTADRMSAVLAGPLSLDRLQQLATRRLSAAPLAPGEVGAAASGAPVPRALGWGDAGGPGDAPLGGAAGGAVLGPFGPIVDAGACGAGRRAAPRRAPLPGYYVSPVAESTQSLSLTWAVPLPADGSLKPELLLQRLVGRAEAGGLLSALRARGLASSVGAGLVEGFGRTGLCQLSAQLTEAGVSRWEEAAALCHAYLGWANGLGAAAFRDLSADTVAIAQLAFRFAEPQEPSDLAEALCGELSEYSPEEWVAGPSTVGGGAEAEAAFGALLCALDEPEAAVTIVTAKKFARVATSVASEYAARYAPVEARTLRAARARARSLVAGAGFSAPRPNAFLPAPEELTLREARAPPATPLSASLSPIGARAPRGSEPASPLLALDAAGWRLHHAPLPALRRPVAVLRAKLATRAVRERGVDGAVALRLWMALVREALEPELAPAVAAGFGWELGGLDEGVALAVRGWGAGGGAFVKVLDTLVAALGADVGGGGGAGVDAARPAGLELRWTGPGGARGAFERSREQLAREVAALGAQPPLQRALSSLRLLLDPRGYTVAQLEAAVRGASFEGALELARDVRAGPVYAEALIAGNADAADAARAARALRAGALGTGGALPRADVPRRDVSVLPLAPSTPGGAGLTLRVTAPNAAETNGAAHVYWQLGARRRLDTAAPDAPDGAARTRPSERFACLELLAQLLEPSAYATLRTREQLGYVVSAGASDTDGASGLYVLVQSATTPPDEVAARIDAFVGAFGEQLARTSAQQFESARASLVAAKRERARRLGQQAARYWAEVARGEYAFARAQEEAELLARVSLQDVRALYEERVRTGGARVRRVTTLVFPQNGPAAAAERGADTDIVALREQLASFGRPRLDDALDA